ncbi:MAG: LA_3696 family protein, partial [Thermodesulfovibrio sp.]
SATKQDIAELRAEVKQDIANLEVKIERVRADLIKWMFIFWAGQVGVLVAILTLFFRVLK